MCIALFSTAHPDYSIILINNRDEFFSRPTAPAAWWSHPNTHILGGRDLLRPIQGTWLGITKDGRLAVLTNFREEGQVVQEARSRGAMVNAFLMQEKHNARDAASFAKSLIDGDGVKGVGGFSLVCGQAGQPLAVISNRTPSAEGVTWIAERRNETVGLSNATFGNRTWPKVLHGEKLLQSAIEKSISRGDSKEDFVAELMQLLSIDTLPQRRKDQGREAFVSEFRHSIFIPPVGGEGTDRRSADEIAAGRSDEHVDVQSRGSLSAVKEGLDEWYGTQKQTVVLVSQDNHVTFVERTLFDAVGQPVQSSDRDRWFEFDIE
ncbi:MAG: hypothetical protein Q9219_005706 [cf. Caloplaca sp. 3 TL-2023]